MTAQDLLNLTSNDLIAKIQANDGLNNFAIERSKFEGWLKVELINILINNNLDALPEIDRIDVTFEKTAIELKTLNTSYKCHSVKKKTRPITKNIDGVITDIHKLNLNRKYKEKFVYFLVFPLPQTATRFWVNHISKIKTRVAEFKSVDFTFNNNIPGKIYCCKIYPKKKKFYDN
ncbi:MAG: hypothetical protein L3J41_14925 [Melioribacteraceae bacterium]|nr:hypothetical protein [Melioribacteraceae bacterium]